MHLNGSALIYTSCYPTIIGIHEGTSFHTKKLLFMQVLGSTMPGLTARTLYTAGKPSFLA